MSSLSLAEFVKTYSGSKLDWDHMYGAQCVDLVLYYIHFCHPTLHHYLGGNAIDEFNQHPDDWRWVRNDPRDPHQLPPVGAVMIWGPDAAIGTSSLGHTAVVLSADVAGFTSFDQNWPLGAPCHPVRHSWAGIVGWGVPIDHPAPPPVLVPPATPPVVVPAPTPAPAPTIPAPPVNPPLVFPPPLPSGGNPPVASNDPNPPAVAPVEIPEPAPVAEAGVSTSEWKVLIGYVIQGAAAASGLLVFKATGVHLDPTVLQIVGGLEVGLTLAATTYIASRGIRKLGTTA